MSIASALFAVALVVGVPILSSRSGVTAQRAGVSRTALYANMSVSLWVLAAIGFLVVKLDGDSLADVYVTPAVPPLSAAGFAGWVAALTLSGLALFVLSYRVAALAGLPSEDPYLRRLMPRGTAESLWVGLVVSPSAGLCEEFLYRGFLLSRFHALLGSLTAAILATSVVFGVAHAYQGRIGAARAGLIGLVLAVPLAFTGSLFAAMVAHSLIDVFGILVVWPRLTDRRDPSY